MSFVPPSSLPKPLSISDQRFASVIQLPSAYEVYDFSAGYDPHRPLTHPYGIGRYNERRPGMYEGEQFQTDARDVHVGIDIAAPVGEPVYSFFGGEIFSLADHDLPYDYGPTVITRHTWDEQVVYALYGHLSRATLDRWAVGDLIRKGERLGWVGDDTENGGWNPHVHFQLSLVAPQNGDLPGAVNSSSLDWALRIFPDPRLVLGHLYDDE